MPATTLFVHHQHRPSPDSPRSTGDCDDDTLDYAADYIAPANTLYIISEHDYIHSLIPLSRERSACASQLATRIATATRPATQRRLPHPLMATLTYPHDAQSVFGGPPGSPPDLTNSKSSKSSSFHSSTLDDFMGPGDLSHFEEINLDESTANKAFASAGRSLSHPVHHSFRDLTGTAKPRYPSLKGQVHHVVQRQQAQLSAPGKQLRRGFTSPSVPSLPTTNLSAPSRSSRSQSPSNSQKFPSSPRTLSRRSSRNLDVLPSPALSTRRQSWQDSKRKTVKEREAECDDDDDDVPEDAFIMNVPISPRPVQERSPAPSTCGSPPQTSPIPSSAEPSSAKPSPAPSVSRYSPQPHPQHVSSRDVSPPTHLTRQRTNTWEDTYTALDPDAKKLTEALEEFQSEIERQQEIKRQQPGLTRSASVSQSEPKSKKPALPPIRKSDPLIDPFQPSVEKQKYLSRTRPSWLPPKNPKEEKKHLKEYQRMLARIEEAERAEALRAQDEAHSREKATRIKAEYWSTLLLPNWATEMTNPELRATHRKMWWNGIPPRLRGQVWQKAIGNDLEVTEATYNIALEKAHKDIQLHGHEALNGRYQYILESSTTVFPELKMFAGRTSHNSHDDAQPLHQDLINVCLAYSTYRPDISHTSTGIHHIAGLLLLNLAAPQAFITLSNLLNRPLPLSFLIHDANAIHAAYASTLRALSKKYPSLATRLEQLRVEPRDYLFDMFSSVFCGRLGVEHAARVMDVYAIEGDKIPPRVAVAVCGMLEGACLEGDVASVVEILREREVGGGDVDGFMARVYEAGKSG